MYYYYYYYYYYTHDQSQSGFQARVSRPVPESEAGSARNRRVSLVAFSRRAEELHAPAKLAHADKVSAPRTDGESSANVIKPARKQISAGAGRTLRFVQFLL